MYTHRKGVGGSTVTRVAGCPVGLRNENSQKHNNSVLGWPGLACLYYFYFLFLFIILFSRSVGSFYRRYLLLFVFNTKYILFLVDYIITVTYTRIQNPKECKNRIKIKMNNFLHFPSSPSLLFLHPVNHHHQQQQQP